MLWYCVELEDFFYVAPRAPPVHFIYVVNFSDFLRWVVEERDKLISVKWGCRRAKLYRVLQEAVDCFFEKRNGKRK
jgi:hypothetical protein